MRCMLRKRAVSAEERANESRAACCHILASPEYQGAHVVGGYLPLAWELDIGPVLNDVLCTGKTLVLPRCEDGGSMTLRRVQALEALVPGAYGLMEPAQDAPIISVEDVELLLVPLEGIDPAGMRLGKGGGYYDRLLEKQCSPAVGCALSHQWVDAVPVDSWDVPLYACADASGIHRFYEIR